MKRNYRQDARVLIVKYAGKCAKCGKAINKGSEAVYFDGKLYCYASDVCTDGRQIMDGLRAEQSFDQYGTDIY